MALSSVLLLAGCGSDGSETAALALTPMPAGKARVTIRRASSLMYAGAAATITLNGDKVADIASGGQAVVDVPAGQNVLAASAWSYPGQFSVKLNAVAGQNYTLEVSPRTASLGPGLLLGPIGGAIDASVNENAGAFEMRVAGRKGVMIGKPLTPKQQVECAPIPPIDPKRGQGMPKIIHDNADAGRMAGAETFYTLATEVWNPLARGENLTPELLAKIPDPYYVVRPRTGEMLEIFGGNSGVWTIKESIKEIIEELEPGVHTFIRVNLKVRGSDKDFGKYFLLHFGQAIDADVIDETTSLRAEGGKLSRSRPHYLHLASACSMRRLSKANTFGGGQMAGMARPRRFQAPFSVLTNSRSASVRFEPRVGDFNTAS